ncbi:DUF1853 family protein [Marinobacterium mangrovicola]|uniref:DUF1853 family protein n=1 Tax=Marinobacterium mangrovicola TaxID=1476959 RepID=A0A4R1GKY6_9GAMM|nr:DUF1853 family protein [Marinobacterium mangrovicola]TCK09064.1 hypothetical protein CLV83_1163 [Marinobacterium mangrovicola]
MNRNPIIQSTTLRNPAIRKGEDQDCVLAELEWLRTSPELMLAPSEFSCPDEIRFGSGTIGSSADLAGYEPRWRLGEHFENIVHFHLKNNDQISDIHRNIQVKKDKVTLGEMDFLLKLGSRWVHLEVALKLYLLDPVDDAEPIDLAGFIGTRRKDCLATKWQRMLSHQLPLSQRPEAQEVLTELGIEESPLPAVWVKGWLFYHPLQAKTPTPAGVNPEHLRGWWVTWSELELLSNKGERFMLPGKPDWLLPPSYLGNPLFTLEELRGHLHDQHRGNLVVALERVNGRWIESSRGFVVPDNWPGSSR